MSASRPAITPPSLMGSPLWMGWSMAILATFGFSITPVIGRGAILAGMDPTTLLMARMVIATLLMGGSIALFAPHRLRIDRRGLWYATLAGVAFAVGMLAFFWALAYIDASIASMLFTLNPLVVLIFLALRGERLSRRSLLRLALGLAGVYLLIGPGGRVDVTGTILVMITVLAFAVQLVILQWYLRNYDAWTVTFYTNGVMSLVVILWWLGEGMVWTEPGINGWLAILSLAVISTYLARLAMFVGVRHIGSGQSALLVPLETFLTVAWSLLFLGERLSTGQWMGGGLILAGTLLAVQRLRLARWRPRTRTWTKV